MRKSAAAVDKGIYQRGPLSFQVRLMIDGHSISGTFNTLEEARAFRNAKKAALALDPEAKRVFESRVKKEEIKTATLASLLDRYQKEVSAKKKSADSEAHKIAKIRRSSFAEKSVYRITPEDVSAFLAGLQREQEGSLKGQPLSETTKRKFAALISHLFTIARKRWRMNVSNPVGDIELPVPGKPRQRRFEGDEEERLLSELAKARKAHVMVPLVQLAVLTAMRQGELLALQWKDVRVGEEHGTAFLHDTKNGEQRKVPLDAKACEILSKMVRPLKGGSVFPITTSALRMAWDSACARAGIEDLRFHDLRHEATSRFFELDLDRVEVASVTGIKRCKCSKITRIYGLRT